MNKSITFLPGWGFKGSIAPYFLESNALYQKIKWYDFPSLNGSLEQPISRSILLGWSLGGLLALEYYHLFPDAFDAIILVCSSPCFTSRQAWQGISSSTYKRFLEKSKNDFSGLFRDFLRLNNHPKKISPSDLGSHLLNIKKYERKLIQALYYLFSKDFRWIYQNCSIPILHIQGSLDAVVVCNAAQFKSLNPHIKYVEIKRGGHILWYTHQHELQEQISDFIRSLK